MSDKLRQHNLYQQKTFSKEIDTFQQPIPEDVKQRTAYIVACAKLTSHDRVLDVGTGIGVLIPYIQQYGVNYIVGCDLSPAMLAEAQRRYPDVYFWCGDVNDIPQTLGPFDVALFNAMFGNVWSQRDTLTNISRQLTQAGRIIISHPMGSAFVRELRRQDRQKVPHLLPDESQLAELIRDLPLRVTHFQDDELLYLCILGYTSSGG